MTITLYSSIFNKLNIVMLEELFEEKEKIFKTLANKKRLEILHLLSDREMSVTDMVSMLGVRQANLSQNLTSLRENKLLSTRREGNNIYYRIADGRILKAYLLIREFLRDSKPEISKLDNQLTEIFPFVVDPVCKMRLSYADAYSHLEHEGSKYYFCASGCKNKFKRGPKKFI